MFKCTWVRSIHKSLFLSSSWGHSGRPAAQTEENDEVIVFIENIRTAEATWYRFPPLSPTSEPKRKQLW